MEESSRDAWCEDVTACRVPLKVSDSQDNWLETFKYLQQLNILECLRVFKLRVAAAW